MSYRTFALIGLVAMGVGVIAASEPDPSDLDLARRLTSGEPEVRQAAVDQIVNAGAKNVPLLLSWTRKPPNGVDAYRAHVGRGGAQGAWALASDRAGPRRAGAKAHQVHSVSARLKSCPDTVPADTGATDTVPADTETAGTETAGTETADKGTADAEAADTGTALSWCSAIGMQLRRGSIRMAER